MPERKHSFLMGSSLTEKNAAEGQTALQYQYLQLFWLTLTNTESEMSTEH